MGVLQLGQKSTKTIKFYNINDKFKMRMLIRILNLSLSSGTFPNELKMAHAVPLF